MSRKKERTARKKSEACCFTIYIHCNYHLYHPSTPRCRISTASGFSYFLFSPLLLSVTDIKFPLKANLMEMFNRVSAREKENEKRGRIRGKKKET